MAKARTRDLEAIREIASRIRSVDDQDPWVNVLVYGPNGSGKTRFIASGPKALIIDIREDGTRSTVGSGAKYLTVRNWEDIGHAYWLLKSLLARGKCPWQTVGLDTISAMQNLAMSFVLGEAEDRDPSREKGMPDKRTYGRAGELMKGMMLAFKDLPMHTVYTAQMRRITDDDTGQVLEYAVDLPAGSRGTATGCASVVGFMQRKPGKVRNPRTRKIEKRMISVTRTEPTDAEGEYPSLKDRTNRLAPVERNLSMPKVIEAWENREEQQ
jgi:hypothetical protein